ncbi:14537_t:CDS:2, partial [Racocetra fulgida]
MNLEQLSKNNDCDDKIGTSFEINISNDQDNNAFDLLNNSRNIILLEQTPLTSNNTAIIDDDSLDLLNGSCNVILFEQEVPSTNNNIVIIDDESFDLFNSSCNVTLPEQASSTNNNPVKVLVGQTFNDWYDVQQHIIAYAINQDFSTRLHYTERCMDFILRAEIVCCRTGVPPKKSTGLRKTKSIAIDCKFKIVIRWAKNKYCIREAKLEHNYPLDSAAVIFDPDHRRLSSNESMYVQTLYNSGVPVPTIINMLTEQYNRYIHNKDIYNSLNRQFHDYVKGLSQTAELLNNLNNNNEYHAFGQLKKMVEDKTFYDIQTVITDADLDKLKDKFTAFNKDFKAVMFKTTEEQFTVRWDCLLSKYPEVGNYMVEQWKSYDNMWAYCYTNNYVNYRIRTTQWSEATNAHLKRLLGHTVLLPQLINALEKLTQHQLQHSQYQQYRLRSSTRQHVNYIGARWIIALSEFTVYEQQNDFVDDLSESTTEYTSEFTTESITESTTESITKSTTDSTIESTAEFNNMIYNISSNQQRPTRSTVDLLKDIETISNQ